MLNPGHSGAGLVAAAARWFPALKRSTLPARSLAGFHHETQHRDRSDGGRGASRHGPAGYHKNAGKAGGRNGKAHAGGDQDHERPRGAAAHLVLLGHAGARAVPAFRIGCTADLPGIAARAESPWMAISVGDTIYAVSSAPGRAAIAVVR